MITLRRIMMIPEHAESNQKHHQKIHQEQSHAEAFQ